MNMQHFSQSISEDTELNQSCRIDSSRDIDLE